MIGLLGYKRTEVDQDLQLLAYGWIIFENTAKLI